MADEKQSNSKKLRLMTVVNVITYNSEFMTKLVKNDFSSLEIDVIKSTKLR